MPKKAYVFCMPKKHVEGVKLGCRHIFATMTIKTMHFFIVKMVIIS